MGSNLTFRISDLRCRTRSASPVGRSLKIRPISKFYLTLFIHLSIGPVTELSAVFGENTNDTWL
jgi:hypothetical protein